MVLERYQRQGIHIWESEDAFIFYTRKHRMTNDRQVLEKLKNITPLQLEDIVNEAQRRNYSGLEDPSPLVDVLYAFYPQYPVAVMDEEFNTNQSILFLEELLLPYFKTVHKEL
jgi:hypothetical protein